MKQRLFTILRLVIAALGIGYILWSLTWTDHVQVPAATLLADGSKTTGPTAFAVSEGDAQTFAAGGRIVINAGESDMVVPANRRGTAEDDFQFKPGITSMIRSANKRLVLAGLFLVGPIYLIQAFRWLLLMRARQLDVTYAKSFKLLMVGSFFNYCMPGSTGGDVVKAYYAARGSGRGVDAIMSIVFDRVTGMVGLILLGGLAGLTMWHHEIARAITISIWSLALILCCGTLIYFSDRWRRISGLSWLVARFPGKMLAKIDAAAMAYRHQKASVAIAIGLSVVIHTCLVTAAILAGYALGISHPPGLMASVFTVLLLGMAIPISYQGLGIMEGIGAQFLVTAPFCDANQLIGMLLLFRLFMVVYSLLGALFLLKGDIHMHPQNGQPQPEPSGDVQHLRESA